MMAEKVYQKTIQTIAISSGKGGVGKTNVVANLAISLQRRGKRVMVFDADLGLSNIDVLLGLAPRYNIQHLLRGEKGLDEIIVEGPEGILILPASSGTEELTRLDEFQKLRILDEFERVSLDIDYLLIDTGAGISSNVTFFCIAAQEIVLIITPEPTSLTDAYALIKVLYSRYQERNFRILVNSAKGEGEALESYMRLQMVAERFLNISLDYMGFIPSDNALRRAVRSQDAVVVRFPDSPSATAFDDLATRIITNSMRKTPKGSIQFFFGNLFGALDGEEAMTEGA